MYLSTVRVVWMDTYSSSPRVHVIAPNDNVYISLIAYLSCTVSTYVAVYVNAV